MNITNIKESLENKGFNIISLTNDELLLLNKCLEIENLGTSTLSRGYYYNSIALCLIDAIFSIGTKYESVCKPIVERFAEKKSINLYYDSNTNPLDIYKLDDFIKDILNDNSNDFGATNLYKCKRLTSNADGAPLRSEVIYKIACFLRSLGINTIADFRNVYSFEPKKVKMIEETWLGKIFSGQTEVSYSYFIMLTGGENMMKIDRWLIRFVESALERKINYSHDDIRMMYEHVMNVLKQKREYESLNLRLFDHIIWQYSKENLK